MSKPASTRERLPHTRSQDMREGPDRILTRTRGMLYKSPLPGVGVGKPSGDSQGRWARRGRAADCQ